MVGARGVGICNSQPFKIKALGGAVVNRLNVINRAKGHIQGQIMSGRQIRATTLSRGASHGTRRQTRIGDIVNERTSEYRLVVKRVIASFLDVMNEPRLHDLSQNETVFWFKNLTQDDIEAAYGDLRLAGVTLANGGSRSYAEALTRAENSSAAQE